MIPDGPVGKSPFWHIIEDISDLLAAACLFRKAAPNFDISLTGKCDLLYNVLFNMVSMNEN